MYLSFDSTWLYHKDFIMTRWALIFLLFTSFLNLGTPRQAWGMSSPAPHVSSLEIGFWPEYDKPSMLVIYTFTLASDVPLPAEFAIRIPSRIGEPSAVAAGKVSSKLFDITYKRQTDGDWAFINLTTSDPILRLEYYDPSLSLNGANRHFDFTWINDLNLDNILIQMQQPVGSRNFLVSPSLKNEKRSSDNLLNELTGEITPPALGASLSLSIDYQKDSDQLSISSLQEKAAPLATPVTPANTSSTDNLPLFLAVLFGIILIFIIGVFLYIRRQRSQGRGGRSRKRNTLNANLQKSDTSSGAGQIPTATYCPKCGQKTILGDQFCRSCGNSLQIKG